MQQSEAKVALVTGGGSGIGAGIARLLYERGWKVAVVGRRADKLDVVASECDGLAIVGDVVGEGAADDMVARVLARYGRLDGLVYNAGVYQYGTLADMPPSVWQRVYDTNLNGCMALIRAAIPALRKSKGSMVSIAAIGADTAAQGSGAYSSSKAALRSLMRTLAVEEASHGIRANTVCPGWTRSEMADAGMEQIAGQYGGVEEAYKHATRNVPLARPGLPVEVAAAVAFLLSDQASYITGASIPVDGGLSITDPAQNF